MTTDVASRMNLDAYRAPVRLIPVGTDCRLFREETGEMVGIDLHNYRSEVTPPPKLGLLEEEDGWVLMQAGRRLMVFAEKTEALKIAREIAEHGSTAADPETAGERPDVAVDWDRYRQPVQVTLQKPGTVRLFRAGTGDIALVKVETYGSVFRASLESDGPLWALVAGDSKVMLFADREAGVAVLREIATLTVEAVPEEGVRFKIGTDDGSVSPISPIPSGTKRVGLLVLTLVVLLACVAFGIARRL